MLWSRHIPSLSVFLVANFFKEGNAVRPNSIYLFNRLAGMPVTCQPWARRGRRAWPAAVSSWVDPFSSRCSPTILITPSRRHQSNPAAVCTHHLTILENQSGSHRSRFTQLLEAKGSALMCCLFPSSDVIGPVEDISTRFRYQGGVTTTFFPSSLLPPPSPASPSHPAQSACHSVKR